MVCLGSPLLYSSINSRTFALRRPSYIHLVYWYISRLSRLGFLFLVSTTVVCCINSSLLLLQSTKDFYCSTDTAVRFQYCSGHICRTSNTFLGTELQHLSITCSFHALSCHCQVSLVVVGGGFPFNVRIMDAPTLSGNAGTLYTSYYCSTCSHHICIREVYMWRPGCREI